MYKNKRILAIIPARGGSKRIKRKNIKKLDGVPLIVYTFEAAKKSKYIDRLLVSTEDKEIMALCKKWGVEVLKRPSRLAKDTSSSIAVYADVIKKLNKENYFSDILVSLQPTSPLRAQEDIDAAIELMIKTGADSLSTFCEMKQHPAYAFKINKKNDAIPLDKKNVTKRSQDLSKVYIENGAVFCFKTKTITKLRTQYGYVHKGFIMPSDRSIDIDDELDWFLAEQLIKLKRTGK